jgi:hypothetical protein
MKKLLVAWFLFSALLIGPVDVHAYSYATDLSYLAGTGITDPARKNTANALGAPDGAFLSLGMGGIAAFDFGTWFDTAAVVFEVTWGSRVEWPEYANVYVGNTFSTSPSDFTFAKLIKNDLAQITIDLSAIIGGPFRYVLLQDATAENNGRIGDGFDIDAVGVHPVPLPAAAWLLGAGVVGLVTVRRRIKVSGNGVTA